MIVQRMMHPVRACSACLENHRWLSRPLGVLCIISVGELSSVSTGATTQMGFATYLVEIDGGVWIDLRTSPAVRRESRVRAIKTRGYGRESCHVAIGTRHEV